LSQEITPNAESGSWEPMIAPCGVDCSVCIGYMREKKRCLGCNGPDDAKPKHCTVCRIKLCPEPRTTPYCSSCKKFPCARMRQLDKRYQANYGTSLIGNLKTIAEKGIEAHVNSEITRWTCDGCGGVLCIHRASCLSCGKPNKWFPRTA
jgi:hypothetical protein